MKSDDTSILSCVETRKDLPHGRSRNHRHGNSLDVVRAGGRSRDVPRCRESLGRFCAHDFVVDGAKTILVEPKSPLPGRPWAWRGEFFGAFPNADIELVKHGWHLAYIDVSDQFGSPKAMERWEKFYDLLVVKHGLSPKPALIGLSRGALYCMAWAALHPEKTLLVYLDNGVCDFKSWPGGKPKGLGTGEGSPGEWQKLLKAFDFKDDREAIASTKSGKQPRPARQGENSDSARLWRQRRVVPHQREFGGRL